MTEYTSEDVDLCVKNAFRLLNDAFDLKPPTRYGIMELALEEAAKAWWVYFAAFPEKRMGELKKVNYKQCLDNDFRDHRVKIGEVQQISAQLLGGLSKPQLTEEVRAIIDKKIAGHPEYPKQRHRVNAKVKQILVDPAERIGRISALLETILKYQASEITQIKENAFYVDRENGILKYPDPKQDYDLLAWILTFVLVTRDVLGKQENTADDLYRFSSRDHKIHQVMDRITERLGK